MMQYTCKAARREIAILDSGQLIPGGVAKLKIHIQQCEPCRKKAIRAFHKFTRTTLIRETAARRILAKVGLDIDDPEVNTVLSGAADMAEFNQRLDALITAKGKR